MTSSGLVATYRIQLRNGMDFDAVRKASGYLARLGVSHLYLSPIAAARSGSSHGYDVTDPARIDPALGGDPAFEELSAELRRLGLKILLDIVPNHTAASPENPWWADVLRKGEASRFARFFDIDWSAEPLDLRGKVFLPLLDRPLAQAVDDGTLVVEPDAIRIGELRIPLATADGAVASKDNLEKLLGDQHYVLGPWQDAVQRVNYRRFFDVNELVSMRVEEPDVFDGMHERVLRLARDGQIAGVRIDHIDGLRNPGRYLARLQEKWPQARPGLVYVEKILGDRERCPTDWQSDGTTGYEFMDRAVRLLTDADGLAKLDELYADWVAVRVEYPALLRRKKAAAIDQLFAGAFATLARDLAGLLAKIGIPVPAADALDALRALTCALPVYRTYLGDGRPSLTDETVWETALSDGLSHRAPSLRNAIRAILRLDVPDAVAQEARSFVQRWQQYSGPVMAKGHEDTGIYLFHRLIAFNDVGGHPDAAALEPSEFHDWQNERTATPRTLNATSTHDTKRSEDVRARLLALSELPAEWDRLVRRLRTHHAPFIVTVNDRGAPTPNMQYLLYQTLVGSWPLSGNEWATYPDRIRAYMQKAAREGKRRTNWLEPNELYEEALDRFVATILDDAATREHIQTFVDLIAPVGGLNSLSLLALKMGAPGVPDVYRGAEVWDFSLVDPDNRRAVDYAKLDAMLAAIDDKATSVPELLSSWRDGRVKLHATATLLRFRARHQAAFEGAYEPLRVRGGLARHVIAFRRRGGEDEAIVVVPRLLGVDVARGAWPTGAYWHDTRLELGRDGSYRNALDGSVAQTRDGSLRLADLLGGHVLAFAERV